MSQAHTDTYAPPPPARPEAAKPAGRMTIATAAAVLIVAAVAAYANSFAGRFILDDGLAIPGNPTIRNLWSPAVLSPPSNGSTVAGRPMLNFSLAVSYALSGTNVWGYHAGNLLIHILATLTLFGLVRRTLELQAIPPRFRQAAVPLALAIALLWSVHPLTTSAVTYMVQRAESLMGLFCLLTLYCLLRGATQEKPSRWYIWAVAACALGMASKEVMATAPVVALLYDRTFLAGTLRQALRKRWRLYAALAATWGLLAWLVLASAGRAGTAGIGRVSPWDYGLTQLASIVMYLRLAFWPHPLVLDYGPELIGLSTAVISCGAIVAVLLAVTLWGLLARESGASNPPSQASSRRPWGFVSAWFFLILAPTSSIVPVITQTAAEHRMYLPLAAIVAAVVLGAWGLWQPVTAGSPNRGGAWRRFVPAALLVAVIAALGWRTFLRNQDYARPAEHIWRQVLAARPGNPRAHLNLAACLFNDHRYQEAKDHCDQAVRIQPGNFPAFHLRGQINQTLEQYRLAIDDYSEAIRLRPTFADAYTDRARARLDLADARPSVTQWEQAAADASKAMELDPAAADPYEVRAVAYYCLGKLNLAMADAQECRRRGGELTPEFARQLGLSPAGAPITPSPAGIAPGP